MNVLACIKPIICISRILGIAPFKFKKKTLKPSRGLNWYSAVVNVAATSFLFLFSANNIYFHSETFLGALMSASHWATTSVSSLLSIYVLFRYKDLIRENLIKLNNFLVLTSRLKIKQLKSLKTANMAYSIGGTLHCIVFLIVYYLETHQRSFFLPYKGFLWMSFTAMGLVTFNTYAWCLQFVAYTSITRLCFVVFNEKFNDVSKNNYGLLRYPWNKRLGPLVTTHGFLTDIAQEMASVFSIYLLTITILVFLESVYTFTHYRMESTGWLNLAYNCIWLSYYVFQFGAVLSSSVGTSMQAEKTANYLHELFIDNDDPELKEEIEIFSLQLLHRKVEFNACGFFKLDFSLLYSMVGAVTTYIIILMQFQGNNPTGSGNCTALKCPNCTITS